VTSVPSHELSTDGIRKLLLNIGDRLRNVFGQPDVTVRTGLDELVLTILSQNTNDRNRDTAFTAMKSFYSSWEEIAVADQNELVNVLRPAGLAPQKAPRIQAVLRAVLAKGGDDMAFLNDMDDSDAESFLLGLPGVGIKTAYCTLLFSFDRPVFPMDTHILRIFERIGILPERYNVEAMHRMITALVSPGRHKDIHLNVIRLGKTICKARKPDCESCPCLDLCKYAAQQDEV